MGDSGSSEGSVSSGGSVGCRSNGSPLRDPRNLTSFGFGGAEALQRTLRVPLRLAETTGVHHPDMTKGEIVPDRVNSVHVPERCCDLGGHLPARLVYRVSRRHRPRRITCVSRGTISR